MRIDHPKVEQSKSYARRRLFSPWGHIHCPGPLAPSMLWPAGGWVGVLGRNAGIQAFSCLCQEMIPVISSLILLVKIGHMTPQHCKSGGVCADLCCPCPIILNPGLSFPRPNPYFQMTLRSHYLDLPSLPQTPVTKTRQHHPKNQSLLSNFHFMSFPKPSHSNTSPFAHIQSTLLLAVILFLYNFPLITFFHFLLLSTRISPPITELFH